MKMKRSKGGTILVPDKRIVVSQDNPFDYLLGLKEKGRAPIHNDIEHMGKSAASLITSMDVDSEINIAKTIRELMEQKVAIPKDMKIDDSDLPTAANFYEWVTQDRFGTIGDERPFLEQLLWGIVAFNDYCPKCTDMEWMLHDHKVDDTYSKFERKVCVLDHGVCPSCGLGRSKAVAKGLMPYYNELAINAGQRCVIGSTPVISQNGLLHIDEVNPGAALGFTLFEQGIHNGTNLETTSHYFVAEPEMVYRVDTARGFAVTGTNDHPIETVNGFERIEDLEVGTNLEIHYGQRTFGQGVLANPNTLGRNFFNTILPLNIRIARQQDIIAFLQGLFREARRVFLGTSALRDVSALLLNAGYPHTITGPAIQLDTVTYANLKIDNWSSGSFTDSIAAITEAGVQTTYDFTLPDTHQFVTGGIISHNSGKSHTVGTYLAPYHLHRLLKLQKPAQFYGLSRTTMLQGTFAALTYTQAKDTLWTPFYGALLEGSWFKSYFGMLKHYENVYGEKLYKLTDTFVDFRVRGLQYHPMGPDKRVMRGRCLRFNTILNTSGGFLEASELIKKNGYHKVSGLEMDSHKGRVKVSHTYKDKSETIRVETRNGYHIEGTPEHPMLVLTPDLRFKWVALDEMKVGDWIVSRTNKNNPMYGDNRAVSKDMATIMGYYVANGYRNEISSNDSDVINNLYAKYQKVTGFTPTFRSADTDLRSHQHYLYLGGRGEFLRDYLRPLGLTGRTAKDKHIPLSIRTAPFEVFHEFLEAYFECDSGINGGAYKGSKYNAPAEIEVGSASRKLARQLHVLLLHAYGIVGRLSKQTFHDKLDKETGQFNAKREHWLITITGYDAMKFLNTFKRAKVQKYRERFKNTPPGYASDRRLVPYFRQYVYDTYENARMQDGSGKKLRTYIREDGSIYSTKKCGFARPTFIRNQRPSGENVATSAPLPEFAVYDESDWDDVLYILNQFSSERAKRIRSLLNQGAHFEEVVSIKEKSKKVNVYDVTVPGTHAFTANGLVSHNTRVFTSIDEIAYFDADKDSNKVKISAFEVYDALVNSLFTVRGAADALLARGFDDVLSAYAMNVSSPTSKNDMIHELLNRAREGSSIYGIHRPTWTVNPNFKRNSKIIVEAYKKDPVSAEKNFGANPPMIANPFLSNHKFIMDCETTVKNVLKLHTRFKNSKRLGQSYMYAEVEKCKKSGRASMLAIDAGEKDNSFSIAGGYVDENFNLVVDLLGEIIPLPGYRINHSLVYSEVILPVMQARNCKVLLADRWNSLKLLDDAALDMGNPEADDDVPTFIAKQHSLKYVEMVGVRTRMEQGQILLPKSEIKVSTLLDVLDSNYREFYKDQPVAHLFKQMFTIRDLEKGVGKGDGYTDDNWRAMALLLWGLMEEEYVGMLMAEPMNMTLARPNALGASKLGGGGGTAVGTGGGGMTTQNGAPLMIMSAGRSSR